MLGVDCRNYKADDFHATMEEINLSTQEDEFAAGEYEDFSGRLSTAIDEKTPRCSRVSYFNIDDIFSGKNVQATILVDQRMSDVSRDKYNQTHDQQLS